MTRLVIYLRNLPASKIVLWCYATWYCAIVSMYFDTSARIWLTALFVSFVIGIALNLSVARGAGISVDRWQTIRLFLMPFCVSSYSSLIKDRGFIVIFPTSPSALEVAIGSCLAFLAAVWILKKTAPPTSLADPRTSARR
jgi:hypothetical protein